jgi:hypothetical protein
MIDSKKITSILEVSKYEKIESHIEKIYEKR